MKTYKEIFNQGCEFLKDHNIEEWEIDAWYLMSHVFGINKTNYFMDRENKAPVQEYQQYKKLLEKRATRTPLQHIIGSQEFMGLEFVVSPDVLIPRQDTESLVEEVLKISKGKAVLDMCTGSACIIISLAKLSNLSQAVGVDVSRQALKIALKNKEKHNVDIELIESNLFDQVKGEFDIIVSNPPYIPSADIEELMDEVREHEPLLALDGSGDGLEFYRNITRDSKKHLKDGGHLYFEIGYDQAESVENILRDNGFTDIKVIKDLGKLDRVIHGIKGNEGVNSNV